VQHAQTSPPRPSPATLGPRLSLRRVMIARRRLGAGLLESSDDDDSDDGSSPAQMRARIKAGHDINSRVARWGAGEPPPQPIAARGGGASTARSSARVDRVGLAQLRQEARAETQGAGERRPPGLSKLPPPAAAQGVVTAAALPQPSPRQRLDAMSARLAEMAGGDELAQELRDPRKRSPRDFGGGLGRSPKAPSRSPRNGLQVGGALSKVSPRLKMLAGLGGAAKGFSRVSGARAGRVEGGGGGGGGAARGKPLKPWQSNATVAAQEPRKKAPPPKKKGLALPKKSVLGKLRKAVNAVKMANRLMKYTKVDSGRMQEDSRKKAEKKQLRTVWRECDVDGGGALDKTELKLVLKKMGKNFNDAQVEECMAQIDEDGGGEVEFSEFEAWWDREMEHSAFAEPQAFNFNGQAVRGVKLHVTSRDYHWVANDLANVLFPLDEMNKKKASKQSPEQLRKAREEAHEAEMEKLQKMWGMVDEDQSGTLDMGELHRVFELMGRNLNEHEMKEAMSQIDVDGGGEVDYSEFVEWWGRQDPAEAARMMMFNQLLSTFAEGECISLLISGPTGPEEAKIVSARGLFRLVLRAQSQSAQKFHVWSVQAQPPCRTPFGH
jgi:Ca2+-binding EF-hand superfamily protein